MAEPTEDWEFDFQWLQLRHQFKNQLQLDSLPNLQAMLLLVGIQELGQLKEEFTKEEKQDLMQLASCRLLAYEGYFEFEGLDAEGWPHYRNLGLAPKMGIKEQEKLLKSLLLRYAKEELGLPTEENPN